MLDKYPTGQNEHRQADERLRWRDGIADRAMNGFSENVTESSNEGLDTASCAALQEMTLLLSAMNPLDGDGYGNCVHCRAPIDSTRLTALPFAVLCVDCAEDEGRLAKSILHR